MSSMKGKKNSENFWMKDVEALEMDMKEISNSLPVLDPHQAVMIWGGPGIGKTQLIESTAKKVGADCRTIVTSTYEPTDISGVPMPVTSREGAMQYVRYLVAKWGYDATVESGNKDPMILFFDDLVTAHEQVQAACYRLFLDREIGDLKLRDNVRIYAAGNRPEDNAATHDMPTPLGNRMLHIYAKASPDAWVDWAVNQGAIYPWCVGFIRTNQHMLYTFSPDSAEKAFASPRSIEMLSKLLYRLDKHGMNSMKNPSRFKLSSGLVGRGFALEFYQWVKIAEKAISPRDIVKNPEKVKIPEDLDLAHATVAACESYLRDHPKDWKPILTYALRLEPELGLLLGLQVSDLILQEDNTKLSEEEKMKAALDKKFVEMWNEWGSLFSKN